MCDLVVYPDPSGDDWIPNADLQAVLDSLGVSADIGGLYEQFFTEPRLGRGDVFAFQNRTAPGNVFVIDMYQDLTNQVDFVSLALRCDARAAPAVRKHIRAFFDAASIQAGYEEANCSLRFRNMFDREQYPRRIEESGYLQQWHLRLDDGVGS